MVQDSQQYDDEYRYDPQAYAEARAEVIPAPGIYKFKALKIARKAKNGTPVMAVDTRGGEWPTITLQRVELVEPQAQAGKFAPFVDIKTRPFARNGPGGTKVGASEAADVLRSIDQEIGVSGFEEVYQELEQRLAAQDAFVVKTGLGARDMDWIKAQLDQLGETADPDAKNEIFNKGTLRTKDFRNADGTYRYQAPGPSGKILDAKLVFSGYVPSKKVGSRGNELGPYPVRAA